MKAVFATILLTINLIGCASVPVNAKGEKDVIINVEKGEGTKAAQNFLGVLLYFTLLGSVFAWAGSENEK